MKSNRRIFFYLLVTAGVIWVIGIYEVIIAPILIGAITSYLLYPFVTRLKKRYPSLSHQSASTLIFILFTVLLLTTVGVASPIVFRQSQSLNNTASAISSRISGLQPRIERLIGTTIPLDDFIMEVEEDIEQFFDPQRLYRLLWVTTSNFMNIVLAFITCFYLLRDWRKTKDFFTGLFPQNKQDDFRNLLSDLNVIWKNYLRGQFSLMLIIGFITGILGFAVGLRSALLIGIIAGVLELIPSIGPTITTIIAGITAWIYGSSYLPISNFRFAVLICGLFIAVQVIESLWIQPKIISKRMNLHPGLVLIAIAGTVTTLGIIAGLIIIPIIGSIIIVVQFINQQFSHHPPEHSTRQE